VSVLDPRPDTGQEDRPRVKAVLQWSASPAGQQAVQGTQLGGHPGFPPLPTTLDSLKARFTDLRVIVVLLAL